MGIKPNTGGACPKCGGRTYGWGGAMRGSIDMPVNRTCTACGYSYVAATGRKAQEARRDA